MIFITLNEICTFHNNNNNNNNNNNKKHNNSNIRYTVSHLSDNYLFFQEATQHFFWHSVSTYKKEMTNIFHLVQTL